MPITASQVKEIRQEFARLKPARVTLDGNRRGGHRLGLETGTPEKARLRFTAACRIAA